MTGLRLTHLLKIVTNPNNSSQQYRRYGRIGFISILLFGAFFGLTFVQSQQQHLIIAVGKKSGESYIISQALSHVIKSKSNIDIEVCTTDGTEENIKLLREGKVDLATSQADYATEQLEEISQQPNSLAKKAQKSDPKICQDKGLTSEAKGIPQTVAVLYQDFFHIFVKDTKIQKFADLKNKYFLVDVPAQGGQGWSFLKVAEHYGLQKGINFDFADLSNVNKDFCPQTADVVFRVRALGNQDIHNLVEKNCGKLLPITQAAAMKIQHPSFKLDTIPVGTYKSDPPIPDEKGLETVAISRLLLASDRVPQGTIESITKITLENRQEILRAIDKVQSDDTFTDNKKYDYQYVKPLISSISSPLNNTDNISNSIQIHPGALAYYNHDSDLWKKINENGNVLNFLIALVAVSPLASAIILGLLNTRKRERIENHINSVVKLIDNGKNFDEQKLQLDNIFNQAADDLTKGRISQESFRTFNEAFKTIREALERKKQLGIAAQEISRKNTADEYINKAIALMNQGADLELRQAILDETFNKAAKALTAETISQESFRTFNEAYKTTRESIERERQLAQARKAQAQREISEKYIHQVVQLLQDQTENKSTLHQQLDTILQDVAASLTQEKISEESFRTFVEAYKTTRDAIDRRS